MKFESHSGAAPAESVPVLPYLEDDSIVFDYILSCCGGLRILVPYQLGN